MDEFFAFVDDEQTFNPYTDHTEDLFHKSISHTNGTSGHVEHAQEQNAIDLELSSHSEVGIALSGSSQDTLPDDILIYILVLVSQDYGPVTFPIRPLHIRKRKIPSQLVLSHVCSRWRILALHTSELWNNICLVDPDSTRMGLPYHEWLLRAGSSPIKLSLCIQNPSIASIIRDNLAEDNVAIASVIQDTVLPLTIKMLHLDVTFLQLKALSSSPNTILPHIEKLELTFRVRDIDETFSRAPTSFTRLRSVTLREINSFFDSVDSDILRKISLPWSQLQCLILALPITNLPLLICTLRRMPLLQDLHLHLSVDRMGPLGFAFEELVVPSLRRIQLEVRGYSEDINMVIRHFTFPALIQLEVIVECWTDETYEIIKRQYNSQGLEELLLPRDAPPVLVSSILKDMPKLRALRLRQDIMDDDAITGLSNGTLGCHLRELTTYFDCYIDQWISMVETRKRTVDKLIEKGCNWREMITVLKNVEIFGKDREWHRRGYKERVDALEKAGITVKLPRAYMRW